MEGPEEEPELARGHEQPALRIGRAVREPGSLIT